MPGMAAGRARTPSNGSASSLQLSKTQTVTAQIVSVWADYSHFVVRLVSSGPIFGYSFVSALSSVRIAATFFSDRFRLAQLQSFFIRTKQFRVGLQSFRSQTESVWPDQSHFRARPKQFGPTTAQKCHVDFRVAISRLGRGANDARSMTPCTAVFFYPRSSPKSAKKSWFGFIAAEIGSEKLPFTVSRSNHRTRQRRKVRFGGNLAFRFCNDRAGRSNFSAKARTEPHSLPQTSNLRSQSRPQQVLRERSSPVIPRQAWLIQRSRTKRLEHRTLRGTREFQDAG
jgi:hypothetical protein